MSRYHNPAIKQLTDQQVRYAPVDVRVEQVDKAERLLMELEPEQEYRYQDLCERITDFKPSMYPDLVVAGKDAIHDLGLFVEDMSASASLSAEQAGEPVLTVDDLSQKFNVSTKTVDRWRKRGLVGRRFRFGNRSRIGFLTSAVDRFVRDHKDEVRRGSRFSQLSEDEREEIIRKARRLARHGACPAEVSKRLSKTFDRSPETIRYTLRQYDEQHRENAVFPNSTLPLSQNRRREIFQKFQRGVRSVPGRRSVPDADEHLPDPGRGARRAALRAPCGLHGQPGLLQVGRRADDPGTAARSRQEGDAGQTAAGTAAVSRQPVFHPAADA